VTLGIYGVRPPAEVMPLARDAGKRALAASPHQASAYASMACVDALYDWAWDRADAGFARAVELDPNLASAYQWRAMHHLLPLGKFAAAQSALTRAHELDPVSPAIAASRGLAASFAGDAPRALRGTRMALARDPDSPLLHFFHGVALGTAGDAERALGEFDAAAQLGDRRPELIAAVGYTRARLGDRAAAETALVELAALAGTRYVSPVAIRAGPRRPR
jgi:tetratricopeptide (TPR) repeat protein